MYKAGEVSWMIKVMELSFFVKRIKNLECWEMEKGEYKYAKSMNKTDRE